MLEEGAVSCDEIRDFALTPITFGVKKLPKFRQILFDVRRDHVVFNASRCFARTVCRNLVLQCLARLRVFKHLHFTVTAPMINGQISDDGIQPSNVWREVRVTASYAGLALALDPPSLSFSNQI